jgi:folate-binding protein YgfZ
MNTLLSQPSQLSDAELQAYHLAKHYAAWRDMSAAEQHLGKLALRGNDALDLLQRLSTNDVSKLAAHTHAGEGTQTAFVTEKARILDVATVLVRQHRSEQQPQTEQREILLLLSNGQAEPIGRWLDKYTFIDDVHVSDVTHEYAEILLMGPRSAQVLDELTRTHSSEHPPFHELRMNHWKTAQIGGAEVIVVKQPTLCELCYLLLVPAAEGAQVRAVFQQISSNTLPQISEAVFETLRIEAGWGKLGAEWTLEHNPLEAALVSMVSFTKGCYIGQEVIARLDTYNKTKVHLVGFVADEPILVGAKFLDETAKTGADIGSVTSTTFSPELGKYIALGYLRTAYANPGVQMNALAADTSIAVTIVKLPFVM